jgi:hypothetical protein
VKSLAQDPAVWKAVLSNEKVMELTQSLNEGDGALLDLNIFHFLMLFMRFEGH